jgi:hypothetical protein
LLANNVKNTKTLYETMKPLILQKDYRSAGLTDTICREIFLSAGLTESMSTVVWRVLYDAGYKTPLSVADATAKYCGKI